VAPSPPYVFHVAPPSVDSSTRIHRGRFSQRCHHQSGPCGTQWDQWLRTSATGGWDRYVSRARIYVGVSRQQRMDALIVRKADRLSKALISLTARA
jgi:hypothetical protein